MTSTSWNAEMASRRHVFRRTIRRRQAAARGSCDCFSTFSVSSRVYRNHSRQNGRFLGFQRETHVGQCELFATLVALYNAPEVFRDSRLLGFVDNTSALCGLISGHSGKVDISAIIVSLTSSLLMSFVTWWEHVESDANASDGPSRNGIFDSWTQSQPWVVVHEGDILQVP